ncbi:hypothetical protein E0Z10_g9447 [Xylaria hypoxylon]|uniref:Uncharacterized protein n=1 Tax=Xylaria hypoxylon TaxID=37992 RepID=A0A4Z0YKF9_9PEZI|nr:hypothetical protein E0Z10_g9447 [Xylaria hypoxylon]
MISSGRLRLFPSAVAAVGCADTGAGAAAAVSAGPVSWYCVDKVEQSSPSSELHPELPVGVVAPTNGPPPIGYVIVAVIAFGPHTPISHVSTREVNPYA